MTSKITLETVNLLAHGTPLEGGFYGGVITIPNAPLHAVVWAPKAQGQVRAMWLPSYDDVPNATSCYDSMGNTRAMAEAGSPLAKLALAANINGFTDWCIPARDVLEMRYRYLKPTDEENSCTFRDGDNPSSLPAGYPYTPNNPAQTSNELFKEGGAETLDAAWYVSSTQYSSLNAWSQSFTSGSQDDDGKPVEARALFCRLIPLNT
jgi:hypothetical protein